MVCKEKGALVGYIMKQIQVIIILLLWRAGEFIITMPALTAKHASMHSIPSLLFIIYWNLLFHTLLPTAHFPLGTLQWRLSWV